MRRPERDTGARTAAALVCGLLALAAARCGYRLRGTGSFLPPHIKTIGIPVFKNLTTRYELDVKLTEAVIGEMTARSKVRLVSDPEGADAVLEGEIASYSASPIAFTGGGRPDRFNIRVTANIVLRDRVKDGTLFANPAFTFIQEYEVPEGSDFESEETAAIGQVAERFARSLVTTILEGF
jgi:outer membrane lipopolysaccharide assembly protein LptE/RlpB